MADTQDQRADLTRRPRRADRLYLATLGPREREAFSLIEQRPGLTTSDLAEALGVSRSRAWQIVRRLETGRVRRERA